MAELPLPPAIASLVERLHGAKPTVMVVGLGYVGLPLSMELSGSGATVVGLDLDYGLCERLNQGRSHVRDVADEKLASAIANGFWATTDPSHAGGADAIILCVPTPLRKTKDPDISYIISAGQTITARMVRGQLLVLESTTYPGTTAEILAPMLRERQLEPGVDVALAYSPERVDPGNAEYGIRNTPKVVSGFTPSCAVAVDALYRRCCDRVHAVSSTAAAEAVKLFENTFRMVNIALVNEFALLCRHLDLDVWEIIEAASTKPFGFMPFQPGPGLGGHCIPVDPHFLTWKLRAHNFTARFIELADSINAAMPRHVVDVVAEALNDEERPVRGAALLVLGVAYKSDIPDVRESPALEVIHLLLQRGANVSYHDPHVPVVSVDGHQLESVELDQFVLRKAEVVVILTGHQCYDWDEVLREARRIVDSRNATASAKTRAPHLSWKIRRI